ncbi:hypothetical protein [Pectobacterium phage PPWS2]|uniref:Holin n=1 Tax=Pectobacterium phage PPWS2 TaxID=2153295 RepID=A0A3G9E9S6_9CAUD|nr:holin [Pectobacterium phage PPWS2]BBD74690.1 hypothetical protein [Pectobacterium phage PPWS2]
MHSAWLFVCTWVSELVGDFYSKVSIGTSALLMGMGGLNWNMIFMVAGFLMGLATLCINWYYKHKNSKVFAEGVRRAAEKGYVLREPKE